MKGKVALIAAVAVMLSLCTAALATEYFVATNGDDSWPGTITQPFRTITKGTSVAVAGDIVNVRAGSYAEDRLDFYSDGAPGAYITLQSYDGDYAAHVTDGVWVHARKYIKIIGMQVSGATNALHIDPGAGLTPRSQYIYVERCYVHSPGGGDTAKANQSDYVTFVDCEIAGPPGDELVDWVWVEYSEMKRSYLHDFLGYGFTQKGGSKYNILDSCVISHASGTAARATRFGGSTDTKYRDPNSDYATQYSVYRNNILRDTTAEANGTYGCWYAYFYNNTVHNCGASDRAIINHHSDPKTEGDGGSRHLFYFNNVFMDTGGDMPIYVKDQSGKPYEDWQHDYNCFWNAGNPIPSGGMFDPNQEPHSTFGNPNLANPTGSATTWAGWVANYCITSASSSLIDKGSSTAGNDPRPAVHCDIEGNARPQGGGWDIGASEYLSGPVPPVANFTGNPTSGPAPLNVAFTDTSSGSPTSWSWAFGDGGTSAAQNPSHTYTSVGSKTVSLTATNQYGSDTETKTNYITVVQAQDYFCNSLTVNNGTIQSGDHTSVHASDDVYLVVKSAKSGGKQVEQVTYTYNTGLGSLSSLSFTVEGKVSAGTQPQTVYVYNYSTSAWDSKSTSTLTTSDTTASASVTSPSNYISGGTVQVRVKTGGTGSTVYNHLTDLVKITAAP